jgi:hypothetical protein
MRPHEIVIDHRTDVVVGEFLDFHHFMGGAEAVEEMDERHARLQGRRVRDEGVVHHLLHRVGAQHRPTCGARRHHVLMVAEDRERLGGNRARGDVKDGRRQLAGDLVHVGDHQEQALRGGEHRRERPGLQRAVHRTRSAAFALHFLNERRRAPDVLAVVCGPRIRPLAHGTGWGDRVNRDHLADAIRDRGGRFVAVDCHHLP